MLSSKNFLSKLASKNQQLIAQPARAYQTWGKLYKTGFDRMLLDKLSFSGIGGNWFVLFGLANALAYGASLFMTKDQYLYHFSYDGERSALFRPFKSMMGSNNLANAIWTAPSIIGFGWYLNNRLGSLKLTKFFGLTLFTSYVFLSAVSPQSGLNFRPL